MERRRQKDGFKWIELVKAELVNVKEKEKSLLKFKKKQCKGSV